MTGLSADALRGVRVPPDLAGRLTITIPEAGEVLGVGRGAAYAAARRGEIPTIRLGGRLLVPTAKLLELLGITAEEVA